MKYYKCIAKKRKNNGEITDYLLKDKSGNRLDITSQQLKAALHNNEITVVNLTLTSDNRIISKEKTHRGVIESEYDEFKSKEHDIILKAKILGMNTNEALYRYLCNNVTGANKVLTIDEEDNEIHIKFTSSEAAIKYPQFSIFVTSMKGLFANSRYKVINLHGFNTTNVVSMEEMFSSCRNLKKIYFPSDFCTTQVKSMKKMFQNCDNLEELNLRAFNTCNVTNMHSMFNECINLKAIHNKFNTRNVEVMTAMFKSCYALKYVDTKFYTFKLKDMDLMFSGCESLEQIDLGTFYTNLVRKMEYVFYECKSLKSLDLGTFNTRLVESMKCMFYKCNSLERLNISTFDFSSIKDKEGFFGILTECNKLKDVDMSVIKRITPENIDDIPSHLK